MIELCNKNFSIFITDKNGNLKFVNDRFLELVEYKKEELIGKNASVLKSGVHDQDFYQSFWSNLSEKKQWKGYFCNKTKSGKLVWMDTSIYEILVNDEIEYLGIRKSVDENIFPDNNLTKLGEFVKGISNEILAGELIRFYNHDIANSITVIQMSLNSLMKKVERNEEIDKKIGLVERSVDNCTALIRLMSLLSQDLSTLNWESYMLVLKFYFDTLVKSKNIKIDFNYTLVNKFKNTQLVNLLFVYLVYTSKNIVDTMIFLSSKSVRIKFITDKDEIRVEYEFECSENSLDKFNTFYIKNTSKNEDIIKALLQINHRSFQLNNKISMQVDLQGGVGDK